jgi:hypothetical protein
MNELAKGYCVKCGYTWVLRKEKPKVCPHCHCFNFDKPSRYKLAGHQEPLSFKVAGYQELTFKQGSKQAVQSCR